MHSRLRVCAWSGKMFRLSGESKFPVARNRRYIIAIAHAEGEMAEKSPDGSERLDAKGNVFVKVSNHRHFGTGFIRKSHLVHYESTGETVKKGFCIHHIDFDKKNNSIENLKLMTMADHSRYHRQVGIPWNKGTKGKYSESHREALSSANKKREWKDTSKKKISEFASGRTDLKRGAGGRYEKRAFLLGQDGS